MSENTDNKNVVFDEAKFSASERASDLGWGERIARWVARKSNGVIKTVQEANTYLIIGSLVVIGIAILIALYVGK